MIFHIPPLQLSDAVFISVPWVFVWYMCVCVCVCVRGRTGTLKVMIRCVKWNSASRSSWIVTFSTPGRQRDTPTTQEINSSNLSLLISSHLNLSVKAVDTLQTFLFLTRRFTDSFCSCLWAGSSVAPTYESNQSKAPLLDCVAPIF